MKRIVCALLAVLMLASLWVAPVSAAADAPITPTEKTAMCTCGCGQKLDAVQWKPWDPNKSGHPLSGHYYLAADYAQSKQYQVNSAVRAVIDLRGHKLTTEGNSRLFLIYGYLAVIDTVGGGRMCAKSTGTANGGAVMLAVDGVAMNEALDGTFELRNCTLTLDAGNNGGAKGGLISVSGGSNLKVYDSKLLNATASGTGGAIYAGAGSNVELFDSSIIGCATAKSGGAVYSQGSVVLENCQLTGCEAGDYGGAIYMNGGSLTAKNTKIESGVSKATARGGGNICAINGCKVSLSDSTLRNGYAACNGGNVYFEKGAQTLTNVTIEGGVAGNGGSNLYCASADAVTTLDGCSISGDVHYENGALTLKGATGIKQNNTGLQAVNATRNTSGLTGTVVLAEDDSCPHCNRSVTWTAAAENLSGHCYLMEDVSLSAAYTITDDVVLDLRGCDITSSDRAFTVAAGAALTLLDSVGGATVTGSGNADGFGGVISNAGTLTIHGGNYVYAANSAKPLAGGGVIYTTGPIRIHGGSYDGSAFSQTGSSCFGGALYQTNGAGAFTMSAGRIIGGTAYRGGSVYIGGNNAVTITGGSIIGGKAENHYGNLAISGTSGYKKGTASITGLSITHGTAGNSGGNMTICYYAHSYMTDCYIAGGTADRGGNMYFTSSSYVTLENCILLGGTAGQGGNVFDTSYVSEAILVDCLITDGKATAGNGGNLSLNNGRITVQGGEIAYGTAATTGGNIFNGVGKYDDDILQMQEDPSGVKPLIAGGSAGTYGGNIYNQGKLTLDAAFIQNGTAVQSGSDLYFGSSDFANLTVGEGLNGHIRTGVAAAYLSSEIYGGQIANTVATTLKAELVLEGADGMPNLCASSGKLYVGAATVKTVDGEIWYPDGAAAMTACPGDGWVKLYADCDLVLTKDCCVDLNGKTAKVSGACTFRGMDSTGDAYAVPAGSAALAAEVKTQPFTDALNGNRYIAIEDNGAVSYHRLEMLLTSVSIRPISCGIYYKGTWGCDSVLKDMINGYGVAVSLQYMPGADFVEDPGCLYAAYRGDTLTVGQTKTGVIIKNIMKPNLLSSTNKKRGEMPIFATAFVQLTDGTIYLSDREGQQDDVAYSLRTAMERMDSLLITNQSLFLRDDVQKVRDFYTQWQQKGMQTWSFEKLKQPEDDGVLKIIILGSSRSVNTFHLLYEVFKDQMPEQPLELGVMYYSGCSMTMHEKFIKNDSYVYHYYHNDNGRWTITSGMNMDAGLRAENWDVILLQAGTGDLNNQMQLQTRTFLKEYIDDHVIDPYELWWHSTWFNSTDPDLYKPPKTAEDAAKVDQIAQLTQTNEAAKAYVLNDPMFSGHIASGTPVMYALKEKNVPEKELFRDHTHLYDFGCLLVGYAWYAQYTGKPVTRIDLSEIPAYLRHSSTQSEGPLQITQEMKQIIVDTVAYTLADPWSVPTGE